MIKNNKGYFLTEVIVAITIVAIAITVLYVNSMSSYIKQKNELTKFNTLNNIYIASVMRDYFNNQMPILVSEISSSKYLEIFDYYEKSNIVLEKKFFDELNVNKIYFTAYNMNSFVNNLDVVPSIKKDLNSLKYDESEYQYRYIVVFKDDSYSTIGVDYYE